MTDAKLTVEELDKWERVVRSTSVLGDGDGLPDNVVLALIAAARASLESRGDAASGEVLDVGETTGDGRVRVVLACSREEARRWAPLVYKRVSVVPSAPSQPAESPWVSVSDRVPRDNQKVLVCNFRSEMRSGSYDSPTGDVLFRDGFWHLSQCTHWKPLEESPMAAKEPTVERRHIEQAEAALCDPEVLFQGEYSEAVDRVARALANAEAAGLANRDERCLQSDMQRIRDNVIDTVCHDCMLSAPAMCGCAYCNRDAEREPLEQPVPTGEPTEEQATEAESWVGGHYARALAETFATREQAAFERGRESAQGGWVAPPELYGVRGYLRAHLEAFPSGKVPRIKRALELLDSVLPPPPSDPSKGSR